MLWIVSGSYTFFEIKLKFVNTSMALGLDCMIEASLSLAWDLIRGAWSDRNTLWSLWNKRHRMSKPCNNPITPTRPISEREHTEQGTATILSTIIRFESWSGGVTGVSEVLRSTCAECAHACWETGERGHWTSPAHLAKLDNYETLQVAACTGCGTPVYMEVRALLVVKDTHSYTSLVEVISILGCRW